MSGLNPQYFVGSVQQTDFYAGNYPFPSLWVGSYDPHSCYESCTSTVFVSNSYARVLGCQVPAASVTFVGRTCNAAGFDGWIAQDVRFSWSRNLNTPADLVMPQFDLSDWNAQFVELTLPGPNVMQVVPEPGTILLLALGLSAVGLVFRERKGSR